MAAVGFRNSSAIVTLNPWSEGLARRDLIGVTMFNGGTRCMVPFGGTLGVFGTLPVAYAIPTADRPIILDMAMSEIPFFQIKNAKDKACYAGASFLSFGSRRFNKMGQDYVVEDRGDGKGLGVYTLRPYSRGERIAMVSGEIVGEHRLHTLQLTAHTEDRLVKQFACMCVLRCLRIKTGLEWPAFPAGAHPTRPNP
jgi:hypothetical protein